MILNEGLVMRRWTMLLTSSLWKLFQSCAQALVAQNPDLAEPFLADSLSAECSFMAEAYPLSLLSSVWGDNEWR